VVRARTCLLAIAGLYTLSGLAAGLLSKESSESAQAAATLVFLPIYVFTYLWMKADACETASRCPPGATPLIVGLYPLAVPYHLLATRTGWRKAISLLWFLGFVLLAIALNTAAAYAGFLLAR
jgi:hypothetical protein